MINKIPLTKTQIDQLYKIASHFPDIQDYTLVIDNSNGIGPVLKVQFIMFHNPTSVDITDVSNW